MNIHQNIDSSKNQISKPILDLSLNEINYMTLEYMVNTDQYERYLKKNKLDNDTIFKKEKRFYRKRILSLTRELLHNEIQDTTLITSFNYFAKSCIMYFKFKDKSDILQQDYHDISNNIIQKNELIDNNILDNSGNIILGKLNTIFENDYENEEIKNEIRSFNFDNKTLHNYNILEQANNEFLNSAIEPKKLTLDNFIIKKNKPKEEIILPQTKDINLKDPKFKNKDVKLKKDSSNNSKLKSKNKLTTLEDIT